MKRSESIKELASALSKAQAKFTNIFKSNTAKITTKSGSSYTYSYADLAELLDMVREPLSANGLSIMQFSDTVENKISITTLLLHMSGEFIENELKLPIVETGNNAIQAIGSSITYGRRYELSAILGIASEKDDDANAVPNKPPVAAPAAATVQTNQQANIPYNPAITLRGTIDRMATEKFGNLDNFKVWRVENNLPETLEGLSDFELAKLMTKVREFKKAA